MSSEKTEDALQLPIEEIVAKTLTNELVMQKIVKPFLKARSRHLALLHQMIGVDTPVEADGVVMRLVEKKGQWVDFTPYELQRTRVEAGPTDKNSFTEKLAKELGFSPALPDAPFELLVQSLLETGGAVDLSDADND